MTTSWIYFIQEIEDDGTPGPYKIGKADNPDGRCDAFRTGNSRRLIIRHVEPGSYPEEGKHHHRFGRYRRCRDGKKTEWFDDRDGKIAAYIAAAPAYGYRGPADRSWRRFWRGFARGLGVVPRGSWRILAAFFWSLFGSRSRKQKVRPLAAVGLAPGIVAGILHAGQASTDTVWMAAALVLMIACTIAGMVRA